MLACCDIVGDSVDIAALPSLLGFHLPTNPHFGPEEWHVACHIITILRVTAIEGKAEPTSKKNDVTVNGNVDSCLNTQFLWVRALGSSSLVKLLR